MDGSDGKFKWQEGYGALSIGERSLETVKEYAANKRNITARIRLLRCMREWKRMMREAQHGFAPR
jgi:hypothetical protein